MTLHFFANYHLNFHNIQMEITSISYVISKVLSLLYRAKLIRIHFFNMPLNKINFVSNITMFPFLQQYSFTLRLPIITREREVTGSVKRTINHCRFPRFVGLFFLAFQAKHGANKQSQIHLLRLISAQKQGCLINQPKILNDKWMDYSKHDKSF